MAAELPVRATLLHVVNLNVFPVERRLYEDLCRESEVRLRVLAQRYLSNCQQPTFSVRTGTPHEEIVAEAKSELTELIIVSSPKPSRWPRLFGNGTVERVVREAPCLTLVLPPVWRATPEQYRQATRPRQTTPDFVSSMNPMTVFRLSVVRDLD